MADEIERVLITGNTYPVKDAIKALGGRWDPVEKGWLVPADKEQEIKDLLLKVPVKRACNRNLVPCGYPGCNPPNHCDECDGEGMYPSRY